MSNRYICNPADFAGNFIREVEPIKTTQMSNGKLRTCLRRQVELECLHCKKHFKLDLSNAKRIKQKCCSVQCSKALNFHFGIPNEKHPLYSRWLAMTQRCNTPSASHYHRYGGRGITIEPYLQDFVQYAEYLMSLPNAPISFPSKLQVDRIDNNGNYERGNLRWATNSTNMVNAEQPKKKYQDKYIGVNWSVRKKKYCVRLKYKGQLHYLGWFDNELEGAKVRDKYIKKHNLPNRLNNV